MSNLAGRPPLGLKGVQPKANKRKKPGICDTVRKSAQGEQCTLMLDCCAGGTETVVLCHVREPGDGIGLKPPDYWSVYACHLCHDALDGRNGNGWMCGDADVRRAVRKTQDRLFSKGLLRFGD